MTPDYATDTSNLSDRGNHAVAEWRSKRQICPASTFEVRTGNQRFDGSLRRLDQGFFFSAPTAPAVFSDSRGGGALTRELTGDSNPLAHVELPPGTYALNAKAALLGGGSEQRRAVAYCVLRDLRTDILYDEQWLSRRQVKSLRSTAPIGQKPDVPRQLTRPARIRH